MHVRSTVLLLAFCVPLPVVAETTYTYTGNDFSVVGTTAEYESGSNYAPGASLYTTSDSVTGWFTVATPLAPDLTGGSFTPDSFSFSDGIQILTDTNSLGGGQLSTDASGNIVGWEIQVLTGYEDSVTGEIVMFGGPGFGNGDGPLAHDTGDIGLNAIPDTAHNYGFGESVSSGTWTESATPEPSSIVLLLTGLAGMAGVARRKLSR